MSVRPEDDAGAGDDDATGEVEFEQVLNLVGDNGPWQRRMLLWVSVAPLVMGLHSLSSVVLAATPSHWCAIPPQLQPFNLTRRQYLPWRIGDDGKEYWSQCNHFNVTVSPQGELVLSNRTLPCDAWQYDMAEYGTTVSSEWDLVCWSSPLVATIQASFMLAVLVGFLASGALSDVLGRRRVAFWSSLVAVPASFAVALSPSLPVFLALRTVLALALPGFFSCLMVLCLESVGPSVRNLYGILYQVPFALGLMLAAGLGWLAGNWRVLQVLISAPSLLLLVHPWVLHESPRWLVGQHRLQEAADVLHTAASTNKRSMPAGHARLMQLLERCRQTEESTCLLGGKKPQSRCAAVWSDLVRMFRTPRMRRISLASFWCLLAAGLISYGLPQEAAVLAGGRVYTALLLSGAVELLADVISVPLTSWLGRRRTVSLVQFVTAVPCLLILAVPQSADWACITLAMTARFAIAAGLNILAFYSAELFPTELRTTGFGAGATAARFGTVVAPFVVDLAGDWYWAAPSCLFAGLAISAALAALLLPETRGKKLPDTVEEVEASRHFWH